MHSDAMQLRRSFRRLWSMKLRTLVAALAGLLAVTLTPTAPATAAPNPISIPPAY